MIRLTRPLAFCVPGGPALNAAEVRGLVHAYKAPSTLTTARHFPSVKAMQIPLRISLPPRHDVGATWVSLAASAWSWEDTAPPDASVKPQQQHHSLGVGCVPGVLRTVWLSRSWNSLGRQAPSSSLSARESQTKKRVRVLLVLPAVWVAGPSLQVRWHQTELRVTLLMQHLLDLPFVGVSGPCVLWRWQRAGILWGSLWATSNTTPRSLGPQSRRG